MFYKCDDFFKQMQTVSKKPRIFRMFSAVGVEAAVWSETMRTADHMYSMIFPRLLALAERAWHKAPWEGIKDRPMQDRERTSDWVNFANTLGYKELSRLDKMGVAYHVTPPGAR